METQENSIYHVHRGGVGRYALKLDGGEADLNYRSAGRVMSIEHTFTPPAFRGQGVASRLMARAVEDARAEGLKVAPLCSYAARWFEENPAEKDLLA